MKDVVGKIKSISIEDQSIIIDNYENLRCPIKEVYFYQEDFFKDQEWIFKSMLDRDIIRFYTSGRILVSASPYGTEF